ncbi:hypothetical protein lerEdw1_001522 [Lerista edwardsae]|nr:hypothetical protein lerEdw1_001523 [Lerista edwardsae]KAJ6650934.1 hypothetical protein lerEdw1_001522 [Lerista edwardsae]
MKHKDMVRGETAFGSEYSSGKKMNSMHLRKEHTITNSSSVTDFLLLNFSEIRELQILHFIVVLVTYLTTVTWNLLIITAVAFDHHLHTPMYFFLMNLAIFDIGSVSVIFPKSMANSIQNSGDRILMDILLFPSTDIMHLGNEQPIHNQSSVSHFQLLEFSDVREL